MSAMELARAREIAESLHGEDREPGGAPLLAHIRRVVEATRPDARPVAWLHEALETGHVSEQDLLIEGLGDDELRALRLLCRSNGSAGDDAYLGHVDLIARAAGRSGDLARAVKIADLTDRCRHPRVRAGGWSPPYARGLRLLLDAAGDQLSGPPANLDPARRAPFS
jgi:hypothetical protein